MHELLLVVLAPPVPASATYKFPAGPNFNPRGRLRPEAYTEVVATKSFGLQSQRHPGGRFFLQEERIIAPANTVTKRRRSCFAFIKKNLKVITKNTSTILTQYIPR